MPPFHDFPKWNNRLLNNLLYYQTNYFALMLLMIILCAAVHFRDVVVGLTAILLLSAALVFSLSSYPRIVQVILNACNRIVYCSGILNCPFAFFLMEAECI